MTEAVPCNRRQALGRIAGATITIFTLISRIAWGTRPSVDTPNSVAAQATNATAGAKAEEPFEIIDLDWRDVARDREVPVRLYWPRIAERQNVPLVVFSHGIGGSRAGYSYLGRFWAGRGIASMHVQHVGSDRNLWFGNIFTLVLRLQAAAQENEVLARVEDFHFALDQLLADERGAHIDRSRVIAAGHSYGANTVLLSIGAKVERKGRLLQPRDPRFTAAIVISAPPFYGEPNLETILDGVHVPTLHVTATDDIINIPGYHSPAGDRIKVFAATGSKLKTLAVFAGGSHSIFTDRRDTGGIQLNPRVKSATQALSLAFLRRVFDNSDGELVAWSEKYRPLIASYAGN